MYIFNSEGEVVFTLETQYVKCVINISAAGYRGYVTEPTKGYVRHRKIYMDIKEPITDFKELKKVTVYDYFLYNKTYKLLTPFL